MNDDEIIQRVMHGTDADIRYVADYYCPGNPAGAERMAKFFMACRDRLNGRLAMTADDFRQIYLRGTEEEVRKMVEHYFPDDVEEATALMMEGQRLHEKAEFHDLMFAGDTKDVPAEVLLDRWRADEVLKNEFVEFRRAVEALVAKYTE